jgi:hypothetical protein
VKNPFHRHIIDRRVNQWPHNLFILHSS